MNLLSFATAHEAALIRVPATLQNDYVEHRMSALLRASADWLEHLRELQQICTERRLARLIVDGAPERWEHEGREACLPLAEADLIITPDAFWFRDRLRGQRTTVETARIDMQRFLRIAQRSSLAQHAEPAEEACA